MRLTSEASEKRGGGSVKCWLAAIACLASVLAGRHGGQAARFLVFFLVVAAFLVDAQEAVEFHHRAGGAQVFLLVLLAGSVVHLSVSLELKEDVACVYEEEEDRCRTGNLLDAHVPRVGESMKCCGENQTAHGQEQQAGCCLRYCDVESLLNSVESSEEKAHAHY